MNGSQALAFARDRHDVPGGDLGRSADQGRLLLSALGEFRRDFGKNPGVVLQWMGAGLRNVQTTGLSIQDLLTLAFTALAFFFAFRWTEFTGGESGLRGVVRPAFGPIDLNNQFVFYGLTAIVVFAAAGALLRVVGSRFGSVLVAIRENEQRALFTGYPVRHYKLVAFVISATLVGVAGSLFTFWAELGFVFPPFPFIAHSRGWDAEDMQNNVRQVKMSDTLREAAVELLDRAVDFWTVIDRHRAELDKPMERAGRKASTLPEPEEIQEMAL